MGYSGSSEESVHYFDNVVVEPIRAAGLEALSPEQQWYNDHPLAGGSAAQSPSERQTPPYPGESSPRKPSGLAQRSSGDFTLEDLSASLPLSLSPGASLTFWVRYQPSSLGAEEATLVIESNDADEPNVEEALTGNGVLDPLSVLPSDDFHSQGHPGGPFTPASTAYNLANGGAGSVAWEAESGSAWLSLSPLNGTLGPGESVSLNAEIASAAQSLGEGEYRGQISIRDLMTGLTQTREAVLTVYTSPDIWTSPSSLSVTLRIGQHTTETLVVGNSGDAMLNFNATSRETGVVRSRASKAESAPDRIVLEYQFPAPQLTSLDSYDLMDIAGLERYVREGAPMVPALPVSILIPYGKAVEAIRVTPLGESRLEGPYLLAPGQRPRPLSRPGLVQETPPDPAIYGSAALWPQTSFTNLPVQSKRGYQLLTLTVFPLRYSPATGEVLCASSAKVEVLLSLDRNAPPVLCPSAQTAAYLAKQVENPDALATYPAGPQGARMASRLPSGGPYQYVVITNEELASAPGPANFQTLRDAKIAKGVSAGIVTTEYIFANYNGDMPSGGQDNPTQIRNFLMDAYQNWGTEYVLLGGRRPGHCAEDVLGIGRGRRDLYARGYVLWLRRARGLLVRWGTPMASMANRTMVPMVKTWT